MILHAEHEIQSRVDEMGEGISYDYRNHDGPLVVLGVLNGAAMFACDLARAMGRHSRSRPDIILDFMSVTSYGHARESSGNVRILSEPRTDLEGRDVLLVEDIVDTGNTIKYLVPWLKEQGARSVEVCAFLTKGIRVTYAGFVCDPDHFVYGYGLDDAGRFRHLPYIATIEGDNEQ